MKFLWSLRAIEIAHTVKVMEEDWEWWLSALAEAGVLATDCKTTAYTYIGKELTWPTWTGYHR